jgi:class 3 adenylate cyclase/tetratricopeptide (TPR) repeat protein
MLCPSCSTANPEHAGFCGKCGARLATACPKCGSSNDPTARFCTACGTRIDAAAESTTSIPETRGSSAPFPLQGERKEVSVLFADISGSLALIVDRDPEAADAILTEIIDRMRNAVHRYGGTVNKMRGDGIMALFGAPRAQEDHAARACCAAVAIRNLTQDRLQATKDGPDITVKVRIGINSGEAVVRGMNTDVSVDYDAVGDVVHLASRMEQTADPGTIRITGDTLRLAEGLVETSPLGRQPIKGITRPIEIHELTGIAASPLVGRPEGRRGLTPFANRKTELEILHQALAEAAAERGQLVAVAGEAGFGKSRLITEFLNSPRAGAWGVLRAASRSYDSLTNYLPFVRIFQKLLSIGPNDAAESVGAKVRDRLVDLGADLDRLYPALLYLLGAESDDRAWRALEPQARRQRLIDAIRTVLVLMCRAQPLILVIEDLHWIDTETQSAIDQVVDSLPRVPILCIVTYRPEYRDDWSGKSYYRHIRLGALREEDASKLLQSLIGTDAQVDRLKRMLLDRTEANPFFLEERVYSLVDDRTLVGERGAYQVAGAVDLLRIPGTVRAVLSARIDRLQSRDKRVLQSAAVIGETVALAILRLVENLSESELHDAIDGLRRSEFLYETQYFPEAEYCFRHALTHDVAYGSMLREHRRAIHAKVVWAMETHFGDRADDFAERLVHHAHEGMVWDKVVRYGRIAGAKAAWRSSNREAVNFLEQALQGLEHLERDAPNQALAIDIRFDLRNPIFQLGNLDAAIRHLSDARDLAERLGDQGRLARALMYLSHVFWLMGDQETAFRNGEQAAIIAETHGDAERRVRTQFHIGLTYLARCDFRRASEIMRATVVSCRSAALSGPLGPLLSMALGYLVRALAELGEFAEAVELATEGIRIAETEQRPFSTIIAYVSAGYVHDRKAAYREAIPLLERGLELSRSTEERLMTPIAAGFLGATYASSGRAADAIALLKDAIDDAAAMRLMINQPARLAALGRAYLEAGNYASAMDHAAGAEVLALEQREPGPQAVALLLMGEIAMRAGGESAAHARDRMTRALSLAMELGMRPLAAHCHRGLGRLAMSASEPRAGDDELKAASELYSELGMTPDG